jgi:CRISPR/Cas system-associated exonuclease Cas4 (RecB family)
MYDPAQGGTCVFTAGQHETKQVETQGSPRAYLRHVQQVSLYRLLLWENGIEVDSAEIIYQDMREQLRVPITLLPLADARALLETRLALHQQPTLPDILRDASEQWECNFCPVRATCEQLHGAPVGKGQDA